MSVSSDIRAALADTGLPVEPNFYTGTENTFIHFNYATVPHFYANDEHQAERYMIQVHLVAPASLNTVALKAQIKTLLHNGGFDYPRMVDASDDDVTQHIVFDTEVLE